MPRVLLQLTFAWFVFVAIAHAATQTQGVLEVRIKDHREAIGDFSHLRVKIAAVAISRKPGLKFWQSGWTDLEVETNSVDLTQYTGNKSARILRVHLDAGSFDGIDLKLEALNGTLKSAERQADIKNFVAPLKLGFNVPAAGETVVVLDLVVIDMSDHPPRSYELNLRGYEIYTNGKLTDKIPPG